MSHKNSFLIFSWGNNTNKQLPLNSSGSEDLVHPLPRSSSLFSNLIEVSSGEAHSLFFTSSGKLFSSGLNADGRLGIGKSCGEDQEPANPFPEQIVFPSGIRVTKIACGARHSLAILSTGQAYSWGNNDCGALSVGDFAARSAPSPVKINDPQGFLPIIDIAAGGRHSLFLCEDGRVFSAGAGENGQLGILNLTKERRVSVASQTHLQNRVSMVACGIAYSLFLNEANEVFACGANSLGQLGLGHRLSEALPQKQNFGFPNKNSKIIKIAACHHSGLLTEQGEVYLWGTGVFGQFLMPTYIDSLKNIVDIRIGECFGSARDFEGFIYTWGNNTKGQLGVGDTETRRGFSPVVALQNFRVEGLACGYDFVIAFGRERDAKRSNGGTLSGKSRQASIDFLCKANNSGPPGHSRTSSVNINANHSRNNSNQLNGSVLIHGGNELAGGNN